MNINIRGNIETTEAIKDKITKQLQKLNKYPLINQNEINAKVIIKSYPKESKQKITVTLPINSKLTLKAIADDENLYNAVDKVIEKIGGQIRKHKTQRDRIKSLSIAENTIVEEQKSFKLDDTFLEAKEVSVKPISVDEAIMQMELTGHDFYLFIDVDNNKPSVVYKKKNKKDYGLLEATI